MEFLLVSILKHVIDMNNELRIIILIIEWRQNASLGFVNSAVTVLFMKRTTTDLSAIQRPSRPTAPFMAIGILRNCASSN